MGNHSNAWYITVFKDKDIFKFCLEPSTRPTILERLSFHFYAVYTPSTQRFYTQDEQDQMAAMLAAELIKERNDKVLTRDIKVLMLDDFPEHDVERNIAIKYLE
tara:strand:- start:60 stop:371 length:312 start_codon:yes stop_codon:yes gene_type:complete